MAVDLKWRDACLASRAFTAAEKAAGWPAAMTPEQLAGIQRPHLKSDIEARNRKWALKTAIVDAVKARELPAGKEVVYVSQRQTEGSRRAQEAWKMWKASGRSNFNYDFRSIPGRDHCPPVAYEDVHQTRNDILPADFAAWLHAQGDEPSVHVRNWFEARSVAWPPVVGADEASLFPLPDWAALVRYRTSYTQAGKRAPSWGLGNQLQTARAELERRQAGGASKTDAGDVMGRELGYQGNAPHKQLFKALFSERKKNPPAGGLESVVRHAVGKKQA